LFCGVRKDDSILRCLIYMFIGDIGTFALIIVWIIIMTALASLSGGGLWRFALTVIAWRPRAPKTSVDSLSEQLSD